MEDSHEFGGISIGKGCPPKWDRGAGGYNNKDCFMRETDQEGYVDFVKTVRIL